MSDQPPVPEPLSADPDLRPLIQAYGPKRVEPAEDPFERLVVSVVNQQLSTASARAIRGRLFDRVEITPQGLLTADEAVLRDVGLSASKVEYLRSIAQHFEDGLDRRTFDGVENEAVMAELTEIRGIGTWTAKMFLLFVLGREDVFPVEDLAIRRAMADICGTETRPAMVDRAEPWRPHRSVASLYLWSAYEDGDGPM